MNRVIFSTNDSELMAIKMQVKTEIVDNKVRK